MTALADNLAEALFELGRLGVRATGFLSDGHGNPGAVTTRPCGALTTYCGSPGNFDTPEGAREWAAIVATIARQIEA